jgi:hypothetical protein
LSFAKSIFPGSSSLGQWPVVLLPGFNAVEFIPVNRVIKIQN